MKYTYAYKTSDGVRHEAVMEASSRDAVFAELRKRGIKAIKVVAADGAKANGELRGVRKRVVVWVVVAVAIATGTVAYFAGESNNNGNLSNHPLDDLFTAQTRRQVIGDAAVIEKGIRTGWSDVFSSEGDRFLASFAIPGMEAGVRTTSISALEAALKTSQPPQASQTTLSLEARQIQAMVEGMKQEARAYLAAGGSVVEYGKRLTERQDAEIAVYKRAESEILTAQKTMSETDFNMLYEKRNDELRNLGIRPVTLSE